MTQKIIALANGRLVLTALLATLVGASYVFTLGPYPKVENLAGNSIMPEEQISTAVYLAEFLEQLGPEGRELYASAQLVDLLNPLLLGIFLTLLIAWLLKAGNRTDTWNPLVLVPLLMVLGELWEDALLYLAAGGYPAVPVGMQTLPMATLLKFISLTLCLLIVVGLAGLALAKRLVAK
ncbi:MAG: hypothetical protein OXE78_14780 [Gammaproteobacteria bacterium]|nr:hypothetical protein [Gammaproteobacteria bacterium]